MWLKTSDFQESARFNPDAENVYHLFTRQNPSISQPMIISNGALIGASNFDPSRRTVVLIHGWLNTATSTVNAVLVPAFLFAQDVNVIVVDWYAGAGTSNYLTAVINTPISGASVARFLDQLNAATGAHPARYHIVGHSLGGHQAGIVGRNVNELIEYITALDPALPGWITNEQRFRQDDGAYTEVIHTNTGAAGYVRPLGHADFYPNGGTGMPGCSSAECDHDRCFHYLAESLYSGGFTGTQCATYLGALIGNCARDGTLNMGGIEPKIGSSGIFWLETNASPPFSIG